MIDGRGFPGAAICDLWEAGFCGRGRMPAAAELRPDWDAKRVRAAAREARDADQARRLLAIAAATKGTIGACRPRSGQWVLSGCAIGRGRIRIRDIISQPKDWHGYR